MKTKFLSKLIIALCAMFFMISTSQVFAATKLSKPTIKSITSSSYTSLKITWNSVSGAKGYQLYSSTDKKTWKKVKTTTATSYTQTKLTTGTIYYYKVRAYTGDTYSSFSDVVSKRVVPAKTTITSLKKSANKVQIKWSKVTGATGYRVYRSTDNKNWEAVKTTTKMSYIDSGLEFDTKYYYMVRAYTTVNKTRYFGDKSSVKSIKILPVYECFSTTKEYLNYYFGEDNIKSIVGPSGFAGASSQRVILLNDGTLYVSSGTIENEENVEITKVATGVKSIESLESGEVLAIKGNNFKKLKSVSSWLIFK